MVLSTLFRLQSARLYPEYALFRCRWLLRRPAVALVASTAAVTSWCICTTAVPCASCDSRSPPGTLEGEVLIGKFSSSGLVLRDSVEVKAIPDPKINGITVFMSSVKDGRWKLKYFLSDPTSCSISVNQTGIIKFKEPIDLTQSGEEIHMSTKSLFFRSVKIRRIYDSNTNSLVYVSYADRLTVSEQEEMDKNKYGTSIAVIPLGQQHPPKPAA